MEDIFVKNEVMTQISKKLQELDLIMKEHQVPLALVVGMLTMAMQAAVVQALNGSTNGQSESENQ